LPPVANAIDAAPLNGVEWLFIRVWKQATALELAKGLRFALDVEVGAAKIALNSVRK
jgi:hypothetical protein